MNNQTRALWGARAVSAGNPDHEDSIQDSDVDRGRLTTVTDTLANIKHYCEMHGLDWFEVDHASQMHFEAERGTGYEDVPAQEPEDPEEEERGNGPVPDESALVAAARAVILAAGSFGDLVHAVNMLEEALEPYQEGGE